MKPIDILVFIIGPYNAPDENGIRKNIERADVWSKKVQSHGLIPICPHKNFAFHSGHMPREYYLESDKLILERCDLGLLIPGYKDSPGSIGEIDHANNHDIILIRHDKHEIMFGRIIKGYEDGLNCKKPTIEGSGVYSMGYAKGMEKRRKQRDETSP